MFQVRPELRHRRSLTLAAGMLAVMTPIAVAEAAPADRALAVPDPSGEPAWTLERPADVEPGVVAVRVTTSVQQREVPLYPAERRRETVTLPLGETRTTAGAMGMRIETVALTIENGDVVSEEILNSTEVKAVDSVVLVGTSTSPSASLNWDALAQCESGGDPTIVSASGRYHGLYQFLVSTWETVGGLGLPSQATAEEQTLRAQILYDMMGRSPWPVCGRRL